MTWRVARPCADCPFTNSKGGTIQRRALRPGVMADFRRELLGTGGAEPTFFLCHKTTDETGNGSNLVCAGALAFQARRGVSSNLQRVMENMEWFARQRAARREGPKDRGGSDVDNP